MKSAHLVRPGAPSPLHEPSLYPVSRSKVFLDKGAGYRHPQGRAARVEENAYLGGGEFL